MMEDAMDDDKSLSMAERLEIWISRKKQQKNKDNPLGRRHTTDGMHNKRMNHIDSTTRLGSATKEVRKKMKVATCAKENTVGNVPRSAAKVSKEESKSPHSPITMSTPSTRTQKQLHISPLETSEKPKCSLYSPCQNDLAASRSRMSRFTSSPTNEGYATARDNESDNDTPIKQATSRCEVCVERAHEADTLEILREDLCAAREKYTALLHEYRTLESAFKEAIQISRAAREETEAYQFHNALLEQRNSALEQEISMDRLNSMEHETDITRKYKQEIKALTKKNNEYESRANDMVAQMSAQMMELQNMAMKRMEELEDELFQERSKSSRLESENTKLRTLAHMVRHRQPSSATVDEDSDDTVDMEDSDEDA